MDTHALTNTQRSANHTIPFSQTHAPPSLTLICRHLALKRLGYLLLASTDRLSLWAVGPVIAMSRCRPLPLLLSDEEADIAEALLQIYLLQHKDRTLRRSRFLQRVRAARKARKKRRRMMDISFRRSCLAALCL